MDEQLEGTGFKTSGQEHILRIARKQVTAYGQLTCLYHYLEVDTDEEIMEGIKKALEIMNVPNWTFYAEGFGIERPPAPLIVGFTSMALKHFSFNGIDIDVSDDTWVVIGGEIVPAPVFTVMLTNLEPSHEQEVLRAAIRLIQTHLSEDAEVFLKSRYPFVIATQ